jgi:ribosomal protein S18 acetylase RimI-like enzyme
MITLFESEPLSFESGPLLTHVIVQPDMKRRDIATSLIAVSGRALLSTGPGLDLFVTEANESAVNLYRKIGFEVMDRFTERR